MHNELFTGGPDILTQPDEDLATPKKQGKKVIEEEEDQFRTPSSLDEAEKDLNPLGSKSNGSPDQDLTEL